MNTIKMYTRELVSNAQGEWIEEEKEAITLTNVAGFSVGTNVFQVVYTDGSADIYKLAIYDRINIVPIVQEVIEETPVH